MASASTPAAAQNPALVATPSHAWWQHLFSAIDARDSAGFVALLTPDAHFRFGNGPTVIGCEAIGAAVSGFFSAIASCRHRLIRSWSTPTGVACEGEVTYGRLDGSTITVPFANVLDLQGDLVCSYRIYIDNSPLFSGP
ncbi:MAG: nuclear transport factor 2 family protein [Gammaproteobacteria bacterium]